MKKKPPRQLFLVQRTRKPLTCDLCRQRPAIGYTEGIGERDALTVYCRECGGKGMKLFPRKFRRKA